MPPSEASGVVSWLFQLLNELLNGLLKASDIEIGENVGSSYVCVCVCVYRYVYIYVCIYIYMYMYIYARKCVCVYVRVCVYTYIVCV